MILEEKVIIVTGGEGLIGRAIVRDIRNKGGIAINADITFEKTDWERYELKLDITAEESILEGFKSVFDRFGRIDGLVNNAYPRTKDFGDHFETMKLETWNKNVEYQMSSTFLQQCGLG